MPNRAQIIDSLEPNVAGDPRGMLRLAKMMREDGQMARALDTAHQILELEHVAAEQVAEARRFIARAVPHWHFNIVRDVRRNGDYDAALRRAVKPGMRVLEIGTGTGILAMMAARAGAAEVITCEADAAVARAARRVIAANGYADRVRVIARMSSDLTADDLGGRADLLVSEIVSHNLLSEGVLPAHEHAVRELIKPGAPVIPLSGTIRVALAEGPQKRFDANTVADFDLSAFNTLLPPEQRLLSSDPALTLRSAPENLFRFDFATAEETPPGKASVECVATGGTVTGIVQWIAIDLDRDHVHENAPDPTRPRSSWRLRFYDLPEPVETRPGQRVIIHGAHDRHHLNVWLG